MTAIKPIGFFFDYWFFLSSDDDGPPNWWEGMDDTKLHLVNELRDGLSLYLLGFHQVRERAEHIRCKRSAVSIIIHGWLCKRNYLARINHNLDIFKFYTLD